MTERTELTEAGKIARREYRRNWRKKNAEHVKEYKRVWSASNPEKVRACNARYWNRKAEQANKEKNQGKGRD